jgi:hypothetical protein
MSLETEKVLQMDITGAVERAKQDQPRTERDIAREHFIDLAKLADEISREFAPAIRKDVFTRMLDHILATERMSVDMQMRMGAMRQAQAQQAQILAPGPMPIPRQ